MITRKALLVGIENYGDPANNLTGCLADVNRISGLLSHHSDGRPNFSCRSLGAGRVSAAELREGLHRLFSSPDDIALFYFAGHGFINHTGGSLVTSDYSKYSEGLRMAELLDLVTAGKAKERVVILDCCHAGAMGEPLHLDGGKLLHEGVSILSASRKDESALGDDAGGVFTKLLCDGLEGGASDILGRVSTAALYAYIDEALGPWNQRPIFQTNVSRFTSIRDVKAPIERETLRRLPDYFKDPANEFQVDPTFEFTTEVAVPKNVAILKDLQKCRAVGLVFPVGFDHIYEAAMASGKVALTPLGKQYHRLAQLGFI